MNILGEKEIADLLGVSQPTVNRMKREGWMPDPVRMRPVGWAAEDIEVWREHFANINEKDRLLQKLAASDLDGFYLCAVAKVRDFLGDATYSIEDRSKWADWWTDKNIHDGFWRCWALGWDTTAADRRILFQAYSFFDEFLQSTGSGAARLKRSQVSREELAAEFLNQFAQKDTDNDNA